MLSYLTLIVTFTLLIGKINCQNCPSSEGYFQDPSNCSKFFYCSSGKIVHKYECGSNSVFNPDLKICDWKENTKCASDLSSSSSSTTTTTSKPILGENEIPDNSIETSSSKPPTSSSTTSTTSTSTSTTTTTTTTTQTSNVIDVETENPNEWHPPIGPTTTAEPDPMEGFNDDYKIVCYFTNWAWYRPQGAKYIPEDTNSKYCTHINYGFAVLDYSSLTIKIHDSWADVDNRFLKRVAGLRKNNPRLKVLLSLVGWNDSAGDKYSRLVNNPSARRNFINHSMQFLSKYGFDGLDIDWEYPKCWQTACKDGPESDKANFALFVHELRQAYEPKGWLLTAAVSPSKQVINAGYDVPALGKDFDFINVMAYDMHGQWDKFAAHHAPLYPRNESSSFDPNDGIFNINYTVNYWIDQGMPKKKVILGVPFYGRSFALEGQADSHPLKGYGAPALQGGEPGTFTREKGYLAFYEICDYQKNQGWTKARDPTTGLPFAYKGNQWVGYDDTEQIRKKSEFIKNLGIGGAMVWALDLDDFMGRCCSTKWPLLKTLNAGLRGVKSFDSIDC